MGHRQQQHVVRLAFGALALLGATALLPPSLATLAAPAHASTIVDGSDSAAFSERRCKWTAKEERCGWIKKDRKQVTHH
jgi:hypothetical protein